MTINNVVKASGDGTDMENWVTPQQFGAVGDGVTDDAEAIQMCIDHAATTTKSIFFPQGNYLISKTINVSIGVTICGVSSQSTNGSKIICGQPSIVAILFSNYENSISDLTILGYERNYQDDTVNGYGQISTCTGFRFVLATGAKDIDSRVQRCTFLALHTGIYGVGANLLARDNGFTACNLGIDLYPAAKSPDDFRGFIIEGNRFHKCGGNTYSTLYPSLEHSSCIRTANKMYCSKISGNFADLGIHRFFAGSFGRGSLMSDNLIYQADGDVITIANTSLLDVYDSFMITGLTVNNKMGTLTAVSGYIITLAGCTSGIISNIDASTVRKGGIRLMNSSDNILSNINLRNINAAYNTDGAIYSGIELDATSINNECNGVHVRNTLNSSQARSAIHIAAGGALECDNITAINCGAQVTGEGTFSGNINTSARKPTIGSGSAIPTSGAWRRNDIIYNNATVSGGYIGWVCIAAGVPGTWRGFGLIAAS